VKISVIVLCKGRLHHLKQTLDSLVGQELNGQAECEVLVVDYGCPDGTFDWCKNRGIPNLRCVRVDKDTLPLNKCQAKNFGARCTNADWLMFLDVDLIIPPDLLYRAVVASQETGRQWLLPAVKGEAVSLPPDDSRFWFPEPLEAGPPVNGDFVAVAKFVAADLFHSVMGYDEMLPGWGYEDADLGLRLYRATDRTHYLIPANFIFLNHGVEDSVKFFDNQNKAETAAANLARVEILDRLINPDGYGLCELAAEWPESSSFQVAPPVHVHAP
jgi:glycosyltransferase involved in cell wall biosynthesis